MKKIALLFFAVLAISSTANAQAVAVIEAIAGTLLPGIITGVKQVIDGSSKIRSEEEKNEAKKKIDAIVKESEKQFVKNISPEIENLTIIRSIYTETRKANSSIGALSAISSTGLMEYAKTTDVIEAKKQIAILYSQEWDELNRSLENIKNINISSLDQSLQLTLVTEKDRITTALGRIKSISGFNEGSLSWEGPFTVSQANGRMTAISRSQEYIKDIKLSVENMSRIIDTRLDTYARSFQNLKNSLQ